MTTDLELMEELFKKLNVDYLVFNEEEFIYLEINGRMAFTFKLSGDFFGYDFDY